MVSDHVQFLVARLSDFAGSSTQQLIHGVAKRVDVSVMVMSTKILCHQEDLELENLPTQSYICHF